MQEELPAFAKQWAQQWKRAAPALQAIRDQELRMLADQRGDQPSSGECIVGHRVYDRNPHLHGMVTMQKWFLRRAFLQNQELLQDRDS
jgi:hypothetical protein